uniref:MYND-type domain-containing protein n=1 Tax=Rhabditophanes sp. KR3021 TaxID=114890 RepID=A0AC35TP10_9BILA
MAPPRIVSDSEEKFFKCITEGNVGEVKRMIIDKEVGINCLDKDGLNAVDQAAYKGNEELVEWLLLNGGDACNKKHSDGYTSLMFAALAGNARICQMLLEAGVNSEAVNIIHKTAGELAAFTGQHECVSVINSYISYADVDRIVHPNGSKSSEIFPGEFIKFIHDIVRGNELHPVKIVFKLLGTDVLKDRHKKFVWVIDRLFERQLRYKSSNEMLSLKLWFIYFPLNEMLKYIDSCHRKAESEGKELNEEQLLNEYAKMICHMKEGSVVREFEEKLLRNTILAFPYKNSLIYQNLGKTMNKIKFGDRPSAYTLIMQSLFGQRLVMVSGMCAVCGICSKLKCPKCKSAYCSQTCQKFDWPCHKKCCKFLCENQVVSNYQEITSKDVEALEKDKKESMSESSDESNIE